MRHETVSAIAQMLEVKTQRALEMLNAAIVEGEELPEVFQRYTRAVRTENDFDQWRKDHEEEITHEA